MCCLTQQFCCRVLLGHFRNDFSATDDQWRTSNVIQSMFTYYNQKNVHQHFNFSFLYLLEWILHACRCLSITWNNRVTQTKQKLFCTTTCAWINNRKKMPVWTFNFPIGQDTKSTTGPYFIFLVKCGSNFMFLVECGPNIKFFGRISTIFCIFDRIINICSNVDQILNFWSNIN